MKKIKKLTVHPGLGNDRREEVYKWCTKYWGEYHEYESHNWIWFPTSNYDRGEDSGTFDIVFNDVKAAELFILYWGGQVFDIEYEEYFIPDPEVMESLFY